MIVETYILYVLPLAARVALSRSGAVFDETGHFLA